MSEDKIIEETDIFVEVVLVKQSYQSLGFMKVPVLPSGTDWTVATILEGEVEPRIFKVNQIQAVTTLAKSLNDTGHVAFRAYVTEGVLTHAERDATKE